MSCKIFSAKRKQINEKHNGKRVAISILCKDIIFIILFYPPLFLVEFFHRKRRCSALWTVQEKYQTEVMAPLVPDYGTVIIHGRTDVIGEEEYNMNLSQERARDAQNILEKH